jgi:hypothetical protein
VGYLIMPLGLIVPPGRPPLSQLPVALDEPAIVVAVDEASAAWRSSSTVSHSWTLWVPAIRSPQSAGGTHGSAH